MSEPKEVQFGIAHPPSGQYFKLSLELEAGSQCAAVVKELVDTLQLPRRGAWHLLETWNQCERVIGPYEDVYKLNEEWGEGSSDTVRFCLKQREVPPSEQTSSKKEHGKKMKKALLSEPKLFFKRKNTHKRLRCAKWTMDRALRQTKKRYNNILLQRIVKGDPLWGPPESTPLDFLREELSTHKASNLKLSSEIADLNITSTRLRNQVHPLRQKEQSLTNQLTRLQEEVGIKREEKERRGPKDLAQVQTEIIKLKRELETRNRLNTGHMTKLKSQKDALAEKRKILAEKQKELAALKQPSFSKHVVDLPVDIGERIQTTGFDESDMSTEPQYKQNTSTRGNSSMNGSNSHDREVHTPVHSKSEHKVSSTSKKRHTSKFEAKTRQLVEEEGITFRKVQSKMKDGQSEEMFSDSSARKKLDLEDEKLFQSTDLSTYRKSALYLHTEGPDVLVIPQEDKKWYENSQDVPIAKGELLIPSQSVRGTNKKKGQEASSTKLPTTTDQALSTLDKVYKQKTMKGQSSTRSAMQGAKRTKPRRNVRFAKEALIMNAALEGELDLLKQCVKELGSCSQSSDKGATCLHNAVCSGSMPMVEYLVEMGCDINAQDIDGWTPLHCAAAYSNLDMIRYLIDSGSSLFLTTQDGDTPLKIAVEEYEIQRKNQDKETEGQEEEGTEVAQTCQIAAECLHYLMDMHTSLGVSNNGQVFALFTRKSSDPLELSFNEGELLVITDRGGRGEQWWDAKNMYGQKGQHTQSTAKKNGVVGWVQNTPRGTVVGIAQGATDSVSIMKHWLSNEGSPRSRIDKCEFKNEKTIVRTEYATFSIRK